MYHDLPRSASFFQGVRRRFKLIRTVRKLESRSDPLDGRARRADIRPDQRTWVSSTPCRRAPSTTTRQDTISQDTDWLPLVCLDGGTLERLRVILLSEPLHLPRRSVRGVIDLAHLALLSLFRA